MDFQSLDLFREGFPLLGSVWCGTVAGSLKLVHGVLWNPGAVGIFFCREFPKSSNYIEDAEMRPFFLCQDGRHKMRHKGVGGLGIFFWSQICFFFV